MGGARGGEYYISKPQWYSGNIRSWQQRSSFRARRSSEGCSIAQKGAVQHSSEGRSLSRGCSIDLTAQRSSDRVQCSSEGFSLAQTVTA